MLCRKRVDIQPYYAVACACSSVVGVHSRLANILALGAVRCRLWLENDVWLSGDNGGESVVV